MSRRGNCYDNAPVEIFFAALKTECVRDFVYPTRTRARADLFEYIEVLYLGNGFTLSWLTLVPPSSSSCLQSHKFVSTEIGTAQLLAYCLNEHSGIKCGYNY